MEITKDIWQQVIAPYLNQKVWLWNTEKSLKPDLFDYRKLDLEEGDMLLLKPLSSITDEDENELGNILQSLYPERVVEAIIKKESWSCNITTAALAFQFLQSRGYDLPHYLLNGKTLQECGLAIHE